MTDPSAALVDDPSPEPPGREPSSGGSALTLAGGLLRTARPRQWMKNVLVLAAPFAAARLLSPGEALRLAGVLALFTACAAAVYLINDARDADADRAHPVKCRRPVASGQVPVGAAYAAGAVLALLAPVTAALVCNPDTAALLAGYVVMQLAYCVWLKHVLVIDLVIVTAGFLMRAMAGGIALNIDLSRWFLITSGFGALFMVAAKRYSELVLMSSRENVAASRALLGSYTSGYLRFVWQLAAGVAVLAYCLWAMETGGRPRGWLPWRQLSMIPFTLSVLRYAVFADAGTAGEPEDVVLRDRALVCIALAWGVLYVLAVVNQ
ncbi:decaprenyl-phosphate phosphoribosyltransferase [Streptomyces sp. DvalAA-14]|uniref:decaprenyl-phosphate phosphoribosyltransferase n=1 Tax=unclassified Streptomyces TaxID=2593676 RepID=UPI00081AF6A1|nr:MULTISPECIES: decaprenyl-phosphate phosphoribosyltransferase [unclassified Streptomyces]MYS19134.1 decaprenyl-phosphate phosphoribosyltransferase [Streptomyces sp. SID4948]SCD37505.1 decaprenyl-phosphate phosphoribosyltransferase [Streptomyces sp. DvalAA-14]